jgi:ABC-type transport system substrate-binding protein
MKLLTKYLTLLLLGVVALTGTACGSGGSAAAPSDKLVVGSVLTPSSLDPVHVTGGNDPFFLRFVYDRLLETDLETGEVIPGLATKWGYSEDKMSFSLTLREGVEFSDGTPVDAEAVKLNLERAFKMTKLGHITSVKSVEVVGPHELKLVMAHESAWLAEQLAHNSGFMVSPKAFASTDDVSTHPIGSGPYRIKENVPNSRIVFEKNPDYWNDERGHYPTIELQFFKNAVTLNQALQAGRVQVAARTALTDVKTLQKDPDLVVEVNPSLALYHVQFNTTRPAFADPRVRQAFAYALDREALAAAATDGLGEPTQSLFPPSYEYSNDEMQHMFDYDPDKARALLKAAGKEEVEVHCVTYTGSGYETSAPYIIEQVEAVGFKIDLDIMELPEAMAAFYNGDDLAAATKGPDCNFTSWPGQPTPRDAIQAEYGKSVYNNGHHEYVDFDLLDQLERAYDTPTRIALVQQIELEAAKDPMMANLYTKPQTFAHTKDVTGFKSNLLEFDIDVPSLRPAD